MKKIIYITAFLMALISFLQVTKPASAAKPADTCAYIKDGTILDKFNDPIGLGYNKWGYNYQAHMFNGMYCDAYGDAGWCQQFKDVSLMMKWNDAWMSNKDCGTQGDDQLAYTSLTTPDNKLDRHYPSNSYIGSGAWLTNHATGTYTSAIQHNWNITGVYDVVFTLGGDFPHPATITQTGTNLSGTLAYPGYSKTITSGSVVGNEVNLTAVYSEGGVGTVILTGTIADDGSMIGTWTDTWPNADGTPLRNGTWSTIPGVAKEVYDITCTVSDFVKIVAVPIDATLVDGYWIADDGTEIGPEIWGSFAIIQEIASDPCDEYDATSYMSPLRKGLGNW